MEKPGRNSKESRLSTENFERVLKRLDVSSSVLNKSENILKDLHNILQTFNTSYITGKFLSFKQVFFKKRIQIWRSHKGSESMVNES